MTAEKDRKNQRMTSFASPDPSRLKTGLRTRVADVKTLLGRHPQQARQMLRKLLTGKITMDPIAEAGRGRTASRNTLHRAPPERGGATNRNS